MKIERNDYDNATNLQKDIEELFKKYNVKGIAVIYKIGNEIKIESELSVDQLGDYFEKIAEEFNSPLLPFIQQSAIKNQQ